MDAVAKLTEDERRPPLGLTVNGGGRRESTPTALPKLPPSVSLPPAVSMAMGSRWRRTAYASHLPLSEQ